MLGRRRRRAVWASPRPRAVMERIMGSLRGGVLRCLHAPRRLV